MKIKMTSFAKNEFNNLLKIQEELHESDIDLYFDFSSYDQLLFDMAMYENGDYVDNEFEDLNIFANDISDSEGSKVEDVLNKINKAIMLNLIVVED
jgi:hypothetical protein